MLPHDKLTKEQSLELIKWMDSVKEMDEDNPDYPTPLYPILRILEKAYFNSLEYQGKSYWFIPLKRKKLLDKLKKV